MKLSSWLSLNNEKQRAFLSQKQSIKLSKPLPVEVNDRNTRKRYKICSRLSMQTPERPCSRHSVATLLLTLSKV